MRELRIRHMLPALGRIALGLTLMWTAISPPAAEAAEPPLLISPERFAQSVPPPPPPAPPASDTEQAPPPPAPRESPAPPADFPPAFDPDDPAMQPVKLNLAPLAEWNNLNQQSQRLTIDPRYRDGRLIEPNEPPKDLLNQQVPDHAVTLDGLTGEGGIEHPYFAPVAPFCYYPLYFEEGCLERHGQSAGPLLQPVFSGIEFYSRIGLLPVKMLFERPRQPRLYLWPDPVDPAWEYGF
jgi:hypothetical protein